MENWVFKKNAAGKGEGMLIGKEARLNEIHDVLIKRKFEYINQLSSTYITYTFNQVI